MQIDIEEEMKTSYIDYAMSVIIGRAIPEHPATGLKPSTAGRSTRCGRRETPRTSPTKKSARAVAATMGKYHPRRRAESRRAGRDRPPFWYRAPLVDGQGNFGSVDGDSAAAMRIATEARLTKYAEALLTDLEKETVDFIPNFDSSSQRADGPPVPRAEPAGERRVWDRHEGMATNITHNLREVSRRSTR